MKPNLMPDATPGVTPMLKPNAKPNPRPTAQSTARSASKPSPAPRYDLLDGMRGIAAIAVMVFHITQSNGLMWLGNAWVAVDLFFILSGFVIAHSYGRKIRDGLSFTQFARARLLRLLPLYLVGLLLGLISIAVAFWKPDPPQVEASDLFGAIGLGSLGLPYFGGKSWTTGMPSLEQPVFPLNSPSWSLFFELFVNAVFFLVLRKTQRRWLLPLVLAAYLLYLACTLLSGEINPGWSQATFIFGFPRVVCEFFCGVLICELSAREPVRRPLLCALLCTALLYCMSRTKAEGIGFAASILLAPPCVALLAANQWERLRPLCRRLGELSYPLYIIHYPLNALLTDLPALHRLSPVMQTVINGLVVVTLAYLLALGDAKWRASRAGRRPPAQGRVRITGWRQDLSRR